MMKEDDKIDEFEEALLSLNRAKAKSMLAEELAQQTRFLTVERLVVPVLQRIGEKWSKGDLALSEVYMSSKICEELLKPLFVSDGPMIKGQPKMAVAVLLDSHSMGKKMVYAVLRSAGFDVKDYGQGIEVDDIVKRAVKDRIEILFISVLMLSSALRIRSVREKLDKVCMKTRIVVGGAPFLFDDELWREVGADFMGRDASDAIRIVKRIASS